MIEVAPTCGPGDHCVTCGDEGVPMRVLSDEGDGLVLCRREPGSPMDGPPASLVDVTLVGEVSSGDRVLVHAGIALVRLDSAELVEAVT